MYANITKRTYTSQFDNGLFYTITQYMHVQLMEWRGRKATRSNLTVSLINFFHVTFYKNYTWYQEIILSILTRSIQLTISKIVEYLFRLEYNVWYNTKGNVWIQTHCGRHKVLLSNKHYPFIPPNILLLYDIRWITWHTVIFSFIIIFIVVRKDWLVDKYSFDWKYFLDVSKIKTGSGMILVSITKCSNLISGQIDAWHTVMYVYVVMLVILPLLLQLYNDHLH